MQTIVLKFPLQETLARLRQGLADAGLLLERDYHAALLITGLPLRHLLVLDPTTIGSVAAGDPTQVPAALLLLVQGQGATHTTLGWEEPLATPASLPVVAAAQATLQQRLNLLVAGLRCESTILDLATGLSASDW